MSAVEQVKTAPTVKPGHSFIRGRITHVRRAGQHFLHLVTLPAPDAYTSPQTVEVLAKERLGDVDDDYAGMVRIGGFKRSYEKTDPEDGRRIRVMTADNKLHAVES